VQCSSSVDIVFSAAQCNAVQLLFIMCTAQLSSSVGNVLSTAQYSAARILIMFSVQHSAAQRSFSVSNGASLHMKFFVCSASPLFDGYQPVLNYTVCMKCEQLGHDIEWLLNC